VGIIGLFFGLIGFAAALKVWMHAAELRRAEFIRTYRWPRGLIGKLMKNHNLPRKDAALVARGLRQFFVAYLMSKKKRVSMPSQVVDDLWHEFILYTREYDAFCQKAFGQFLHHSPATGFTEEANTANEGLRRVWRYSCIYESIDPRNPTRLPLLFALDAKLGIANGFHYSTDCEQFRQLGVPNRYCASDFNNSSGCSGGCSSGDGGGHGCSGDGGSCGSGCGGGGD
jgi:hypothetical protein